MDVLGNCSIDFLIGLDIELPNVHSYRYLWTSIFLNLHAYEILLVFYPEAN